MLGAIVSPTDAVAPAEILRRLNAPRRLLIVIEGESLTNDCDRARALPGGGRGGRHRLVLVLGRGPASSWPTVSAAFSIGLAAGWIITQVRARVDDPPTEITISLLSGYAAYLPAEELGFSGVIAAVTVGIYVGWHTPRLTTPVVRMQGIAVWEILIFLLNAVLFLLVGLQLPSVLDRSTGRAPAS